MNKTAWTLVIKTAASVIAMVLIWLLAQTALKAGIDGAVFFGAVAVISGLGGYEIKELVPVVRKLISKPK